MIKDDRQKGKFRTSPAEDGLANEFRFLLGREDYQLDGMMTNVHSEVQSPSTFSFYCQTPYPGWQF